MNYVAAKAKLHWTCPDCGNKNQDDNIIVRCDVCGHAAEISDIQSEFELEEQ